MVSTALRLLRSVFVLLDGAGSVDVADYTIKKGDTFYGIDRRNDDFTLDQLLAANPGVDPKKLQIGQSINFPKMEAADPLGVTPKPQPAALKGVIRQEKLESKGGRGFTEPTLFRIAKGLMEAEHRGNSPSLTSYDPKFFIRTKYRDAPGGSTAFGPGQITATTARDILSRGTMVSPQLREYITKRYLPAGKLMLLHGNEGPKRGNKPNFDATYDYGGSAGLAVEGEFGLYNELFQAVIDRKLKDAGVTAQQVLEGGAARDAFLSKYYAPKREADYDAAFARGIK